MTARSDGPRVGHTRRQALKIGTGGAVLASLGAATGSWRYLSTHRTPELLSSTVAVGPQRKRTGVTHHDTCRVIPGTRVLNGWRGAPDAVEQEAQWIESAAPWTKKQAVGSPEALLHSALRDLRVLTVGPDLPAGAAVSSWSPNWRYVWPRDASFVAVALHRAGFTDLAYDVLAYLAARQGKDGWFEARYLPHGTGPPDGRPRQLDGTGWAAWSAVEVLASEAPHPKREAVVAMALRCAQLARECLDETTSLPPVSPDYWEVSESRLTLGVAAPLYMGLSSVAASAFWPAHSVAEAQDARNRLRDAIVATFTAEGYPRRLGLPGRDLAICFLLPPFVSGADVFPGAAEALAAMIPQVRRPAGGVAPGEDWKNDGISWTPETALLALAAAANGDPDQAESWLMWLASHRTRAGSLPEKVLHDGRPAAVAPLSWTAALAVLAAHELGGAA